MGRFSGALLSSIASSVLVILLLAAFAAESFRDVMLYYNFNTVNPLLAGVFAIGVVAAFAAVYSGWLSESIGAGIALGFALISLLAVVAWALTGRVDVFLASGWAFPVQRWVLIGVAVVIVLGAGLQARTFGLFPSRR